MPLRVGLIFWGRTQSVGGGSQRTICVRGILGLATAPRFSRAGRFNGSTPECGVRPCNPVWDKTLHPMRAMGLRLLGPVVSRRLPRIDCPGLSDGRWLMTTGPTGPTCEGPQAWRSGRPTGWDVLTTISRRSTPSTTTRPYVGGAVSGHRSGGASEQQRPRGHWH